MGGGVDNMGVDNMTDEEKFYKKEEIVKIRQGLEIEFSKIKSSVEKENLRLKLLKKYWEILDEFQKQSLKKQQEKEYNRKAVYAYNSFVILQSMHF